ncbi:MAG: ATP-binding protein [Actinomycetota bacterium]
MTSWTAFLLGLAAGLLATVVVVAIWRRSSAGRTPASMPSGAGGRAEIASKVAHELKNPIMSVKGLASTGTRLYESMSDEERREFFLLIDREADRLKVIADEAATAMRIDAGQLNYVMRSEDVSQLVEEVAWHAPVGDHAMVVETETGLVATIDRIRIAEVLANLIDNAAKFSPSGSPIEVRAYRGNAEDDVVIEIVDRGPGIPSEHREEVFAKFATCRPPGYEETPGAGLGLFISRAHVMAHGGRLDIEDQTGQGTMLRVRLRGG